MLPPPLNPPDRIGRPEYVIKVHATRCRPTERINPVRPGLTARWRPVRHLVLQLRVNAHVVHSAALVQGADRFSSDCFTAGGADTFVGNVPVDTADDAFDHVAALVDFRNDAVGLVPAVGGDGGLRPFIRAAPDAQVLEDVSVLIPGDSGNDDACLVAAIAFADCRVDRHDNAGQV